MLLADLNAMKHFSNRNIEDVTVEGIVPLWFLKLQFRRRKDDSIKNQIWIDRIGFYHGNLFKFKNKLIYELFGMGSEEYEKAYKKI